MMIMDEVDKNLDISTEKCNLNIRTVDQSNRSVQSDVGGTTYEVAPDRQTTRSVDQYQLGSLL